jgi:hypothetical protein
MRIYDDVGSTLNFAHFITSSKLYPATAASTESHSNIFHVARLASVFTIEHLSLEFAQGLTEIIVTL